MRPTLAINMLIRALVRGLTCCGGTWAGCSGCLRKLFTAMPVQDLHYHTSSKLAPAWHNVARAHVTLLHKAYHHNLTHLRHQLPVLRRQSRPGASARFAAICFFWSAFLPWVLRISPALTKLSRQALVGNVWRDPLVSSKLPPSWVSSLGVR